MTKFTDAPGTFVLNIFFLNFSFSTNRCLSWYCSWHDADARPMIYKTENERGKRQKRVKGGRSYFASYCSNAVCCIMAASSQLQKRAEFLALLPVVVACLYSRGKACQG